MNAGWERVAALADLQATGARQFMLQAGGQSVHGFVLRWDNAIHAYINSCPHTGVELNWLEDQFLDVDGRYVQCSMHGALFEPVSGACIHGPCLGQALQSLPVRVEGGAIYVRVDSERVPTAPAEQR